MSRLCHLTLTALLAWTTAGAVDAATDLFGDSLPDGAVQRLGSLRLRYGGISDLGYLPDGRVVVASGNSIDIWDMSVGELQARHRVSAGALRGIHIRRDGEALVACDHASAYEWDMEAAEIVREWETGQSGLVSISYSADESRVLTCGASPATIKEWNLATGEELVSITSELPAARQAVYGPDDRTAFIAHGHAMDEPIVTHYDLQTGELLHSWLTDFYAHHRSMVLSPDGKRLLVGSRHRAEEWQVAPGYELLNRFTGHHGHAVTAVAYGHDPDELLTGSRDGSIRRWNRLVPGGEMLVRWFPHSGHVRFILVSPDGKWALSHASQNILVERSLADGSPRLDWARHELGVQTVACMPEGRTVSGSPDGTVRVWDTLSGEQVLLIDEKISEGVWAVDVSPDGQRIATGGKDGIVREFAASDGRLLRELEGHFGYIRAVRYMPYPAADNTMPSLLSSADDGSISIWGRSGSEPLNVLEGDFEAVDGHRGGVLSLAVSWDGTLLLSGGRDLTMRLWDLQQGSQKAVFRGHRDWVEAVSFAGGVAQGLSAGRDGIVRRWDLNTGESVVQMDHGSAVMSVTNIGDGNTIFAGGRDGTISTWDAAGEQITVLRGHGAAVNALTLSPDGTHLMSASEDSTLLVWETPQQ